jgi:hypothetical protein
MKFTFVMAVAIALAASLPGLAAPTKDGVFPAGESVAGKSQDVLSLRWWQWAASFQYEDSPVSDSTGDRCGSKQEGDVWFLAGTYGSAPARRTCRVPAGKHLFFPLINYVVMPSQCGDCLTCEHSTATAKQVTDEVMGLFAELDGKSLPGLNDHRVASKACFNLAERVPGGPKMEPSASNGYWLLLQPLPKGKHTLRFGGSLPSLRQELIYTLIVE